MKLTSQIIPEVFLIEPEVHGDERGYFLETFRQDELEKAVGHKVNFIQDNESKSTKGVLRGLHYQVPPYAQSKLVKVIVGEILDVAVDIRKGSPTYGKHVSLLLSEQNKLQLYVPRGFAHGFAVVSDTAIISYKVDNYYAPDCDRGLAFNDDALKINWPFVDSDLKLSEKDNNQPSLFQLENSFEYGVNYYD